MPPCKSYWMIRALVHNLHHSMLNFSIGKLWKWWLKKFWQNRRLTSLRRGQTWTWIFIQLPNSCELEEWVFIIPYLTLSLCLEPPASICDLSALRWDRTHDPSTWMDLAKPTVPLGLRWKWKIKSSIGSCTKEEVQFPMENLQGPLIRVKSIFLNLARRVHSMLSLEEPRHFSLGCRNQAVKWTASSGWPEVLGTVKILSLADSYQYALQEYIPFWWSKNGGCVRKK